MFLLFFIFFLIPSFSLGSQLDNDCPTGILHIPPGVFSLENFSLKKDCSLVGSGTEETILDCDINNTSRCLSIPVSSHKITLSHFTLNGHGTERLLRGQQGYVRGIGAFPGLHSIVIDNVRIIDGGQRAIEILNAQNVSIQHVEILGTSIVEYREGDGIHVDGWATKQGPPCNNVLIAHNYVDSPGDTAISSAYCSNVDISHNRIIGAAYWGKIPSREESGIDLTGVNNARVYNNQIWNIGRYCGYASSFPDESSNWKIPQSLWIYNNFCSQFVINEEKLSGFYVIGKVSPPSIHATNIHFIRNIFIGIRGPAISIMSTVKDFSILENILHSQGEFALTIGSSPNRQVSNGFLVRNVLTGKIKYNSTDNIISIENITNK